MTARLKIISQPKSNKSYLEVLYEKYFNNYRNYIASHPRYEKFLNLTIKYSYYPFPAFIGDDLINFVKEGLLNYKDEKFITAHEFLLAYNHDWYVGHLYDHIVDFYQLPGAKLITKKRYLKIMEIYGYYAAIMKEYIAAALNLWFRKEYQIDKKPIVEATQIMAKLPAVTLLHRIAKYYQIPYITIRLDKNNTIDPSKNTESDLTASLEKTVEELIQTNPYYKTEAERLKMEVEEYNEFVEEKHPELQLTEKEEQEEVIRRLAREISTEEEEEIES